MRMTIFADSNGSMAHVSIDVRTQVSGTQLLLIPNEPDGSTARTLRAAWLLEASGSYRSNRIRPSRMRIRVPVGQ